MGCMHSLGRTAYEPLDQDDPEQAWSKRVDFDFTPQSDSQFGEGDHQLNLAAVSLEHAFRSNLRDIRLGVCSASQQYTITPDDAVTVDQSEAGEQYLDLDGTEVVRNVETGTVTLPGSHAWRVFPEKIEFETPTQWQHVFLRNYSSNPIQFEVLSPRGSVFVVPSSGIVQSQTQLTLKIRNENTPSIWRGRIVIACGNEEQYVDVGSRDSSPQLNAHSRSQSSTHRQQRSQPLHTTLRANPSVGHAHISDDQASEVGVHRSGQQEAPVSRQQPQHRVVPDIPLILVPQKVQFPPIEAGRELHRMVTLENRSKTSYIWVLEEETPAYVKVCGEAMFFSSHHHLSSTLNLKKFIKQICRRLHLASALARCMVRCV